MNNNIARTLTLEIHWMHVNELFTANFQLEATACSHFHGKDITDKNKPNTVSFFHEHGANFPGRLKTRQHKAQLSNGNNSPTCTSFTIFTAGNYKQLNKFK